VEDDETKMDKNLQQVDEAASELVRCFSGGKFNFMVSKKHIFERPVLTFSLRILITEISLRSPDIFRG
jgi:hypothetical protein